MGLDSGAEAEVERSRRILEGFWGKSSQYLVKIGC